MDKRSERVARRFDLPMLVAALFVVPVVAVEQSDLSDPPPDLNRGFWRNGR